MVLATEITMPTTAPWSRDQSSRPATAMPIVTERAMPSGPPSRATHFTRRRSCRENSMPTENMSRITPISAKSSKVCRSETAGPGVSGLIRMPPST